MGGDALCFVVLVLLHSTARDGRRIMHECSCVAERVDVYNPDTVVIEKGATVSQGTWLCTATHDFDDPSHPLVFWIGEEPGFCGAWGSSGCPRRRFGSRGVGERHSG